MFSADADVALKLALVFPGGLVRAGFNAVDRFARLHDTARTRRRPRESGSRAAVVRRGLAADDARPHARRRPRFCPALALAITAAIFAMTPIA